MGAWGYKPLENDYALEWLTNDIETPMMKAIRRTFYGFLRSKRSDDVRKHEVEAAASLLIQYSRINEEFASRSRDDKLWTLGIKGIQKLIRDKAWLHGWNEPSQKERTLVGLLSELRRVKKLA